jgi:hypothetical protein
LIGLTGPPSGRFRHAIGPAGRAGVGSMVVPGCRGAPRRAPHHLAGPVAEIDDSGNAHVDQFIHGRAGGPIHTAVR